MIKSEDANKLIKLPWLNWNLRLDINNNNI